MNFVFFGTDDYSVAILEKLISDFFYPVLVVSQPDRPVGRKQILTPPAIKHVCDVHRLPLLQSDKVADLATQIAAVKPDLFIVASFGQIIPQSVLSLATLGALNVHTSLLPAYRGASPMEQAILNGDAETGVTLMMMDAQMDHGPIVYQARTPIAPTDTRITLRAKLATLGADVLCKVLPDFAAGKMKAKAQDESKATPAPMIKKEDAQIDWKKSAHEIERMVRAYDEWPWAWTMLPNQKRLKIFKAALTGRASETAAGTIAFEDDHFLIACGDEWLDILEMQVEGKDEISAEDFTRGYQSLKGQVSLSR